MAETQRRLIRLPEVKRRIGKGRTAIYGDIKTGSFPKPYPIGARAVAWLEDEIDAWIESRIKAAGVSK